MSKEEGREGTRSMQRGGGRAVVVSVFVLDFHHLISVVPTLQFITHVRHSMSWNDLTLIQCSSKARGVRASVSSNRSSPAKNPKIVYKKS